MALLIQDSFTDTNGTALSSHISESGATYARHASFTVATITIEDNRAVKDTDTATAVYYVNNIADPKFFEVEVTIIDKSDVNRSTGIEVGIDTGSDTAIIYRRQNATTWQLLTIIAGTPSATLLSANETFSAEASHTLKLRRIPETNDYECFLDNVSLGVVTIADAEFLGAGKIGFRATNSQGAAVGFHLDNLSVHSLSAPRTLHRGRNFPLFDDEDVNRFEFWPAISTGVVDLPLTLADDISGLADSLGETLGYHVPISDDNDVLSDSETHELGHLLSLSDSIAANWADEHQLLLDRLLALSDNVFNLTDAIALHLEQREEFTDSFTLSDATEFLLTHQLVVSDASYGLPSTPLLDDFNRADEDPATGWAQVFTSASNLRVFSNQISGLSGQSSYGIFTALTPDDDQEVYISVSAGAVGGGAFGARAFLLLRFTGQTSDSATGYVVIAFASSVIVYRVDGFDSFTELLTIGIGSALSAGDKLGARMRGSSLEVWANIQGAGWNRVGTVTDSIYPSGKIGLGIRSNNGDLLLDNFGGGTVIGGLRDAFTQQLVIVDSGVLSLGLADALDLLTEQIALGHGLVFTEDASSFVDDEINQLDYLIDFSDLITLTDTATLAQSQLFNFNDSFILVDDQSAVLSYGQLFADTLTLGDDESNQLGQLLEFDDTLSLSDAHTLLLDYLLTLADAFILSDAAFVVLHHLLLLDDDINTFVDLLVTDTPQGPDVQVGVADVLATFDDSAQLQLDYQIALSDSADTLNDTIESQLDFLVSLEDSFALVDSLASTLDHLVPLADSFSLIDASQQQLEYQSTLADSIEFTDALALAEGRHLALSDNTANWADFLAFTYGFGLILDDNAATLLDAYIALLTHALEVGDSFTLSDALATFGENYLQIDDALTLTDDVDIELRGPDRDVVIVDVLVLTDAISLALGNEFQYQIVLTDTITLYDHYFDLRGPYTPSTRRHIVVPSRARTTTVPAGDRETVPVGSRTTKVT